MSERGERVMQGMSAEEFLEYLASSGATEYIPAFEKAIEIARAIKEKGGRAMIVGGSVRDEIMGIVAKDFDLEIYGMEALALKELLAGFGELNEVGEAFGILKLRVGEIDLDISLPRRESKTGAGHKDFSVMADSRMSMEEAARRRDFTFNTLAKDPLTGEIFDYFGGIVDLRKRILRMTDEERFKDDPLRVLRGMQFVGRFGLMIDDRTAYVMRTIRDELKYISKERFREEWTKLLLRSPKPSLGLNAAMEFGIFHALHEKEIVPMLATPQEPEWHPEGDAWVHTMMVVDEAAKIVAAARLPQEEAFIVMLAAFCHDLGKPSTTKIIDGKITSHAHEEAGKEPTDIFLEAIGVEESLRLSIKKLVIEHLKPSLLYIDEKKRGVPVEDGVIRRLAKRLHPATITQLVMVATADHLGRGPFLDAERKGELMMPYEYPAGSWLLERARRLAVADAEPASILSGKTLETHGFVGGKNMGAIIGLGDRLRDELGKTQEEIMTIIGAENGPSNDVQKRLMSNLAPKLWV
jgi:tRNA nucleotidyltransferase (CCA-adding enzyme)